VWRGFLPPVAVASGSVWGQLRSERQIGGSRVPAEIAQFGAARKALPSFNPFAPVSLLPSGEAAAPGPKSCEGVEQWLAGMKLRELAEDWGIQRTRAFLNRHGHRNAGRILDKYAAFLPSGCGVSDGRLFEIYRDSVEKHLAA
jgi:hypothetical protein